MSAAAQLLSPPVKESNKYQQQTREGHVRIENRSDEMFHASKVSEVGHFDPPKRSDTPDESCTARARFATRTGGAELSACHHFYEMYWLTE
jgi:hypothetical protein